MKKKQADAEDAQKRFRRANLLILMTDWMRGAGGEESSLRFQLEQLCGWKHYY